MKFILDHNLPPALAHAMHELSTIKQGVEVYALRDKFPADTLDTDWINALASEKGWVIVSQDRFKKGDEEKEALRRSGLTVFFLHKQWAKKKYWDKAQNLVRWWPAIIDQAERMRGGSAFRVCWTHGAVARFEQITL
ncbi:hypothetical protein [Endozoicomonas ascidiicola]|uniref:PIN-like domain-containing protein n=1 Tax=Endozoicomonas ascidiicola TaxID=1698521 RepID=UPI00082A2E1A|nr:hypothetical protein [Endozoicomonas ascidiicola]